MTTPKRRPQALTARLRAIAGRLGRRDDTSDDATKHSRVHVASYEHTHRVWVPPDPPRRWFERQGIEKWPDK